MKANIAGLVAGMLACSQSSLAKLITLVESDSSDVPEIMEMIYPYLGKAYCIGITGAAGVGKSTLASALAAIARDKGLSVGIVAADPSSALHGGAVLGDRIRMQQHFLNSKYPPSKLGGIAGKGWDEATPPCDSSPQQAVGYSRWNFIKCSFAAWQLGVARVDYLDVLAM